MYNKILLPTDGSENADRAGKHALWIADVSGAYIVVLNVVELYDPRMAILPISTLPSLNESLYEQLREEGKNIVEDFKKKLEEIKVKGKCKNVKLISEIKEGKPYIEILKTIEDEGVDLVVMGASGRHGLDRFMLGSVTERVVRGSTKPVMVIH
ncbi:MAG: universal stress protein [Methanobacterium sp.]|jgi:nucleotide-binding universal stress UspA family protein